MNQDNHFVENSVEKMSINENNNNNIDIPVDGISNSLTSLSLSLNKDHLLEILLKDKTTGKHIRFACDEYAKYGKNYSAESEILPKLIMGKNKNLIQSRIFKDKQEQVNRTKKSAEVFTPSWICNEMNNSCDEEWFGYKNVFNVPHGHEWIPKLEPIHFANDGDWQKYVDSRRLEITCGEAPFLTSRYDVVSGDALQVEKRIGILDRKLRVVNENTNDETEWFKWAKRAFESTYGYEYQGDSLFLARKNLLFTFIENYAFKFDKEPELAQVKQIANIIAWNVWQMDGLNDCVPFSYEEKQEGQLDLFGDLPKILLPVPCKIRNWRSDKVYYFKELRGGKKMRPEFSVVIGNPPYQELVANNHSSISQANPVYHFFVKTAIKLSTKYVCIITPSLWMTSGTGLDEFRKFILEENHIKLMVDYTNANQLFHDVSLAGGVSYFIWSKNVTGKTKYTYVDGKYSVASIRNMAEHGTEYFIRDPKADAILKKVGVYEDGFKSFIELVSTYSPFANGQVGNYKRYFTVKKFDNSIKIYRFSRNKDDGKYAYINRDKIFGHIDWIDKHKVYVSKAGEISAKFNGLPFYGEPQSVCNETYLVVGPFENKNICENVISYMNTNLYKFLISQIKKSQNASRSVYRFVPMQDFSLSWNDDDLYKKYNINADEIKYIESKTK